MYEYAANSIYYIMSFWQRMVASMPYVRSGEEHLLDRFVPVIANAYIESRLKLATASARCVNERRDANLCIFVAAI